MSNVPDLSVLGEHPEHIQQASDQAAERISKQLAGTSAATPEPRDKVDPKTAEEYVIPFRYKDGRGREWTGTFTNKILDVRSHQAAALLQSEWQLGKPWDSIDPEVTAMNGFLAHMQCSLSPREDAGWARNQDGKLELRTLRDVGLIEALWMEVASHEATFHGRIPVETGGQADG